MFDRGALVGIEFSEVGGHRESRLAGGSTTNHVSCFVRKWRPITARLIRPAPPASVTGVPLSVRSSAGMLDLCGSAGKQTGEDFCRRRVLSMKKVYPNAKAALEGVLKDGMMIMAGGFGLCGMPGTLIEAIRDSGVKNLTCVSNNAGIDGAGLGLLLETRQIKKMIASYVGENKLFAQQYLAGELEIEFNPQGTMAERIRAGGAGIAGFYTKTGVGTEIAKGKEEKVFNGERYILETGLVADLSVIHAWKGDTEGNLVYRKTARNFNAPMATAGRITVAEVEHLVQPGELDGDMIHTPGVFVQRIIQTNAEKRIEVRTTRKRIMA
jgi:3-oxoacid CoA-transferase subunit A